MAGTANAISFVWDGTDEEGNPTASGIYLYCLHGPKGMESRKMILLK